MLRPSRLVLLAALATAPLVVVPPRDVAASTAVALTLQQLVERSDTVVVAVPKSKVSRWEEGRIITYTTVAIDQAVAGVGKPGDNLVVRTLGGIVDGIGQIVHGEAVLKVDSPVMLFLHPVPAVLLPLAHPGSRMVTAMSQGAMPLVVGTDKVVRVGPSALSLTLVPAPGAAVLPAGASTTGRAVSDVVIDVRTLWAARAKK